MDKVAESLKKLEHNEEQIKEFKEVMALLKGNAEKPVSSDLFEKIRKLKICEAPKDTEHCANKHICEREISD